jgi:hypothetical protein
MFLMRSLLFWKSDKFFLSTAFKFLQWKCHLKYLSDWLKLQWATLNGIMDNAINQSVMGIKFIQDNKSQITLSYLMYIEAHSLIIISWLLESVCLCFKVVPLSDFLCALKVIYFKKMNVTEKYDWHYLLYSVI